MASLKKRTRQFDYDAVSNTWDTKYVTVSNTWARKDTVTSYFTKYTLCNAVGTECQCTFHFSLINIKEFKDFCSKWWSLSKSYLLRLYFGVFQPSVVSLFSNNNNKIYHGNDELSLSLLRRTFDTSTSVVNKAIKFTLRHFASPSMIRPQWSDHNDKTTIITSQW